MTGKSKYELAVRHGTEDFNEEDFLERDFWTRASGNEYNLMASKQEHLLTASIERHILEGVLIE